jgi:hypothetical protein
MEIVGYARTSISDNKTKVCARCAEIEALHSLRFQFRREPGRSAKAVN